MIKVTYKDKLLETILPEQLIADPMHEVRDLIVHGENVFTVQDVVIATDPEPSKVYLLSFQGTAARIG